MHRSIKGGGERVWNICPNETIYINAANVPRIRRSTDKVNAITTLNFKLEMTWLSKSIGSSSQPMLEPIVMNLGEDYVA